MSGSFALGVVVGWIATLIAVVFVLALCFVAGDADRRAGLK